MDRFGIFSIFKKCHHNYEIKERTKFIQQDEMGYPLRLCVVKCSKCGKTEELWLDTPESALEELKTGESVLVHNGNNM